MQALKALRDRVAMSLARGIIRAASDGTPLQTLALTLLADEAKDGVERLQEYGFTSVPLAGAECLCVFLGGNRDHGTVIATDDRRYRLTGLAPGEVALHDDRGQVVHLTREGIRIVAPERVEITAPEIAITGDVSVTGELSVEGIAFSTHRHPENDSGGPTDPPI